MKYATSTLEGALLARAVAGCSGWTVELDGDHPEAEWICIELNGSVHSFGECGYRPERDWLYGGPIIERERIEASPAGEEWVALVRPEYERGRIKRHDGVQIGPTALIAAMRAYVASKFGEEVELP
jgi:hypothetical protein